MAKKRTVGGLDRGIIDADRLEFLRAVDKLKRRRPFPDLTEIYDTFVELGYSKRKKREERDQLAEMRAGYEARVADLKRAEAEADRLDAELYRERRESARLARLATEAASLLSALAPDPSRVLGLRREIADLKSGRFALFGAETLTAVAESQVALESRHVTITGAIAIAARTLEKA